MAEFTFITRPARGRLAATVESLWYARGVSEHVDVIFPTAQISLLINLGDPQRITPHGGRTLLGSDAWVIGQQRRVMTNAPQGQTHVMGATFRTVGAAALLGLPCAELTDQIAPLDALWGPFAEHVRQRVGEARDPVTGLAILEQLITDRLSPPGLRLRRTQRAYLALTAKHPASVREACELVSLSNRSLIADFKELIGLRPKEVAAQVRLRRVLDTLATGAHSTLSDLALAHGYCDQAHLNREFRRVSGISPREYLRRRQSAYGDDTSSPNFVTA